MKKISAVFLFIFLVATTARGQDYDYEQPRGRKSSRHSSGVDYMRFGVFIAPNISWMKPTANKSDDRQYLVTANGSRTGFTWGLMIDNFFSENYGVSWGFYLNTTGGKILAENNPAVLPSNTPDIVRSADFSYRLQYVEIPLALKLMSDELPGGYKVFGNIGAALALNVSKRATYDVRYYKSLANGNVELPATGDNEKLTGGFSITPVLLEMQIGGGLEYPISEKVSFYTGLFFNNGFGPDVTNPRKYDLGYTGQFTDGSIRLNNFALRIGLFF